MKPYFTDIAARPPESPYFQKERDTIEKRSGRWLKELAGRSQAIEFDLNAWIAAWETTSTPTSGAGRSDPHHSLVAKGAI